jgi:hypothetical protein
MVLPSPSLGLLPHNTTLTLLTPSNKKTIAIYYRRCVRSSRLEDQSVNKKQTAPKNTNTNTNFITEDLLRGSIQIEFRTVLFNVKTTKTLLNYLWHIQLNLV